MADSPLRVNVGCGRNIRVGWVNIDSSPLPGVDIVCDLDRVRDSPIALADDSAGEFLLSHVLEHLRDPLGLMQELWRIARPDARATIRVPHGGSDEAWEDQTHVRAYFAGSFAYFAQPAYAWGDYGYRGDWQPEKVQLTVDAQRCRGLEPAQVLARIQAERNWVYEVVCELRAVKPARAARRELAQSPRLELLMLDMSSARGT